MDEDNELGRLKAEYVATARRVIDAIRQHGVKSEIFLRASADFEALVERIKSLADRMQSMGTPSRNLRRNRNTEPTGIGENRAGAMPRPPLPQTRCR